MKKIFVLLTILGLGTSYGEESEFAEFESSAVDSGDAYHWSWSGFLEFEQARNISGVGAQQNDPRGVDTVLANRKLRLQAIRPFESGGWYGKIDYFYDDVTYEHEFDVRELRFQYKAFEWLDVSAGRQVSTWGVGDMLFINDLFPKNWLANFQGREMDMLKDPNNSLRLTSYFYDMIFDFNYSPEFTPDKTPTGQRFGVFDPNTSMVLANRDAPNKYTPLNKNGLKIKDDELALSVKKKISNHELALYFYDGLYKAPRGLYLGNRLTAYHPTLNVYGVSDEGQVGPGIFSFEAGYYDSREDRKGTNFLVENSKLKYLFGYRMDLTAQFSFAAQWYQERMLDYDQYVNSVLLSNPAGFSYRKKEYHNTFTLRLTYKAMQETLWLSLFSYLRPQDKDSFTKLEVSKKFTDTLKVTTGVNIFTGKEHYRDREFGMLKDDDNVYLRVNFSF